MTLARAARMMAAAGAVVSASLSAQQSDPSFRATTDTVLVPALVTDATGPVRGLTASDFEVLDNGIPQTVTVSAIESRPIDVTLLLDASASVAGRPLAQFTADINRIAASLEKTDRWRLLAFGSHVSQITVFQPGGTVVTIGSLDVGGTTAVYDALATALVGTSSSDRPQLIFAFTDGADNISFTNPAALAALAARSGATMYVRLTSSGRFVTNFAVPYLASPDLRLLRDLTERTGGVLSTVDPAAGLPTAFLDVLKSFRMRYLLTYTPRNADSPGWHDIVVKTKNVTHTVRARGGYER